MIQRLLAMMRRVYLDPRGLFEAAPQPRRRFIQVLGKRSVFEVQEGDVFAGNAKRRARSQSFLSSQGAQLGFVDPLRMGSGTVREKADPYARAQGHFAGNGPTATQDLVVRMGRDNPGVRPKLLVADLLETPSVPSVEGNLCSGTKIHGSARGRSKVPTHVASG
jgi:hypothetical protein